MADQSSKALPDNRTLEEKYAGNGTFSIPPEILRTFILDEANKLPKAERRDAYYYAHNLSLINQIRRQDPVVYLQIVEDAKGVGAWQIEKALDSLPTINAAPNIQPSTSLMAKDFPPPTFYVDQIFPHGLTLLAGKRKRGKSTICLDIALAVATGRKAFRHFDTAGCKTLYISLEDGERLINKRLKGIQENFAGNANLDFLYDFPKLDQGGVDMIAGIADMGYKMIFLDVLGRVLPSGNRVRQSYDEYALMTDTLGPIQRLANDREISIVILDHVRKAEADDIFDTIIGSSAKWGVADHGMIYERKFKDNDAIIHLSSRWLGDETLRVTMVDGHAEFLGMGEDYEGNREEVQILKFLEEENRPCGIKEIMQGIGVLQTQYPRFRVVMYRLYGKGAVGKTKRGQYVVGTAREFAENEEDLHF